MPRVEYAYKVNDDKTLKTRHGPDVKAYPGAVNWYIEMNKQPGLSSFGSIEDLEDSTLSGNIKTTDTDSVTALGLSFTYDDTPKGQVSITPGTTGLLDNYLLRQERLSWTDTGRVGADITTPALKSKGKGAKMQTQIYD